MRFDTPFDDVFLNRSHVRVLRALHRMPAGLAASGRELARRAGVTHPTALKALALLATVGVVTATRGIAGDAYELNRDHMLFEALTALLAAERDAERELLSFLQKGLRPVIGKLAAATVFGSVVWGEAAPGSDIDLAVSCAPGDRDDVEAALESLGDAVRRRFGNRLGVLVDSRKSRRSTGIWKRIDAEGIPLVRSGKAVAR